MTNTFYENLDATNAHNRAIEDLSKGADFAKVATQFLFAANGGAALAMLSFLANVATSTSTNLKINLASLYDGFAYGAAFYLSGLALCVMSVACNSLSKQSFGRQWAYMAETKSYSASAARLDHSGRRWRSFALSFFILGLVAFIGGSTRAIVSFV